MTLTSAEARQLAAGLYRARQTGVAIPPLTAQYPDLTMADAYQIQQELVGLLAADGERTVGYKLGLTSAPRATARSLTGWARSACASAERSPACGRSLRPLMGWPGPASSRTWRP
jgi:2-keto-4-pentenoate hydratase